MGQWVEYLAVLADPRYGNYRASSVDSAILWRALEGPATRSVERVAAAVALGPLLDAEGKARVARVIETSASDALRKGLRVALDGDEDAIAEQLEELERRA